MVKAALILLCLAVSGCAPTHSEALRDVRPAIPIDPQTTQDTLHSLVLERALRQGTVDFPAGARLVILQRDSSISSPAGLPHVDAVTYYLLSHAEIQRLADRSGDIIYLQVTSPRIQGDSAKVWLGTSFALQRRPGRSVVLLAGGGCSWSLKREAGKWHLFDPTLCLVS